MRLVLPIFISFSLFLQAQGAASLLSYCLSLGYSCKMEMPAGSTCGCEYVVDPPMLPAVTGNCPYDCINCNLEAYAADILLSLPSISRKAEVNRATEAALNMSVAEWLPDPLDILSNADSFAPPPHRPMTEWGVWRL